MSASRPIDSPEGERRRFPCSPFIPCTVWLPSPCRHPGSPGLHMGKCAKTRYQTQRPLPLHWSTQPHGLARYQHPQRRSSRPGPCLLGFHHHHPPPPPPRLSSELPRSALCSPAGGRHS
uniref:Uncharacterized protein n=1 Tax=Mus musculus TaxID=10090 RepID=Q3UR06_MOUSE|nr:unnamed protein product [Mus musculus]